VPDHLTISTYSPTPPLFTGGPQNVTLFIACNIPPPNLHTRSTLYFYNSDISILLQLFELRLVYVPVDSLTCTPRL